MNRNGTSAHKVNDTLELLRFNTCGSVDDGKSTLIGRLLYDSGSLMEDQLEGFSNGEQAGELPLANLTDGLRAEREQGITIDVAYRYFNTPRRRFIIADTPGHAQYTRNMVTGASCSNLSIILVDARQGLVEQSRRHMYLSSLLRVPRLVVAVNKMDLVNWSEQRFREIRSAFEESLPPLQILDVKFIPISALYGDNVVKPSFQMPWYEGPPLLSYLEAVHIASDWNLDSLRLPVQWIARPAASQEDRWHDYRAATGRIYGGVVRRGQSVVLMPSGLTTRIQEIWNFGQIVAEAFCPQSISVTFTDDVDVGRGELICAKEKLPSLSDQLRAKICWMSPRPLRVGQKLLFRHGCQTVAAEVAALRSRIDVATFEADGSPEGFKLNDIGDVSIVTGRPIAFDPFEINRFTGSFILIDPAQNTTVAAGMLEQTPVPLQPEFQDFSI